MRLKKNPSFIIVILIFSWCTIWNQVETEIQNNKALIDIDLVSIDSTTESMSLWTEVQNSDGTVSIIAN